MIKRIEDTNAERKKDYDIICGKIPSVKEKGKKGVTFEEYNIASSLVNLNSFDIVYTDGA